jgi:phosphoenolpyruvate carboxykinase (GTP)
MGRGVGRHKETILPRIYTVNWFRKDADGRYLWPGYGENIRVLKWIVERLEGTASMEPSPIGNLPTPDSIDLTGLDMDRSRLAAALSINRDEWRREVHSIRTYYASFGDRLPRELLEEVDALECRLKD